MNITNFGLEKSRFTYAVMMIIALLGISAYGSLPKRENPAVTIRTASVIAQFEGMGPERVENLIAIPIERKIREIGEVEDIETIITTGQALVYARIYDSVDEAGIASAWEDLRNKMNEVVRELPEGTADPVVNTNYGDVAVATVAITGDGFDLAYLEDVANDFRKAMFKADGVTKVSFDGVQDERIWLDLDNRKLASVGVQLDQVLQDLQAQNVILPAGEIDADGETIVLEANGDLGSVREIENVLTKVPGLAGYVRLVDLVNVRRGYVDPKEAPVFYNGEPAIVASIEMSSDTDIQRLGRDLAKRIAAFEAGQPIGIALNVSTFQETAVTEAVNNALSNVGQTFLVVFVVMLFFLGLRPAAVIACIVPFATMFTLTLMGPLGIEIQQVSIAAVIISLGLLVDNGLVVVEDIEGRINRGEDPFEAARTAGKQYAVPLAVASITTISAFLPMFLIEGTEGDYAYALGAVVAAMLAGSWITALYILPFLSARLIRRQEGRTSANRLVNWYGDVVRRLLPFGLPIFGSMIVLVALALTQFGALKNEMFPLSERSEFLIYMEMEKGTSISGTEAYALEVTDWLLNKEVNPEVSDVTAFVGSGGPRFYLSLDPADPEASSAFFLVNVQNAASASQALDRARRTFIEEFPAAYFRVTRLSMGGEESGMVNVEITGPDADVLLEAADRAKLAFENAATDLVKLESDWGGKVLKIVVDIAQDKARELGVTSEQVSQVMDAYFSGTRYSYFRENDKQIPIVLRAEEPYRDSVEDFINLSIAANGRLISIDQVADFKAVIEYSQIRRENQLRQVIISGKSASLAAVDLLARVETDLDALAQDLGPDYALNIGGEIEDSAEVYAKLGANLPLALGVMLLALIFQFNSIKRSVITFLTIPIIMLGSPFALALTGRPMSFFAVLGLMSLMGIIINNAIVLIDQIDIEAKSHELKEAIVRASMKRARPIILTSLTTILGLFPMALNGGSLFEPMATIMMGGLLVASPLTLIVVPTLAFLFLSNRRNPTAQQVSV